MSSRRADMEAQTHRFQWQGIEMEAVYTPLKWGVIAHLQVRSVHPERARLPITETGYRSQVIAWLDEEAADPAWRRYIEANRQGSLF